MAKKTYSVTLPITGYLVTEVEAESEDEAIKVALESDLEADMIESWEACKAVVTGNVFHGQMNEAEATPEEE